MCTSLILDVVTRVVYIRLKKLRLYHAHLVSLSCTLISVNWLQVPRRDDWLYAGELLMGLKYTPSECDDGLYDDSVNGQLQVHIVEGAGFVDDETRKPFNTFVKWWGFKHNMLQCGIIVRP